MTYSSCLCSDSRLSISSFTYLMSVFNERQELLPRRESQQNMLIGFIIECVVYCLFFVPFMEMLQQILGDNTVWSGQTVFKVHITQITLMWFSPLRTSTNHISVCLPSDSFCQCLPYKNINAVMTDKTTTIASHICSLTESLFGAHIFQMISSNRGHVACVL